MTLDLPTTATAERRSTGCAEKCDCGGLCSHALAPMVASTEEISQSCPAVLPLETARRRLCNARPTDIRWTPAALAEVAMMTGGATVRNLDALVAAGRLVVVDRIMWIWGGSHAKAAS